MPILFLVRHGATQSAKENRFAGWADTPLTKSGQHEALLAAQSLKRAGHVFDVCYTSQLMRAKQTTLIMANELGLSEDAITYDWRLNERHYGALQGELRGEMIEQHGNAKVVEWRRDYHAVPPKLEKSDPRWIEQLDRLPDIPVDLQPQSESMAQAAKRVEPLWNNEIGSALKANKRVLIVAHTSSIRGLARCIEGLDDAQCGAYRISTAIPQYYKLDDDLAVVENKHLTSGLSSKIRYWANRKKPRWLGRI
ncbi:MAG: 2,3-bisphosphoglycerate-dependent phosphoglycerate mutase [Hyphomicrobiales bacterium]